MKQLEVKSRWISAVNKSLIARPMRKYEVGLLKVFFDFQVNRTFTTARRKMSQLMICNYAILNSTHIF